MKKSYGGYIIGVIFMAFGFGMLTIIIKHWEASVKNTENFPLFIVAICIFIVVGLALIITELLKNKKKSAHIKAKANNATLEELFVLEDNYKSFQKKIILAWCLPVPFVLLCTFAYAIITAITTGTANIAAIVLGFLGIAFLLFVCIGLAITAIQSLANNNDQPLHSKGELKKIILATTVEIEKNELLVKEYRLLIGYKYENKDCEFVTQETYSEEQIELIKQYVYLPIIIKNNKVCIDKKQLFKTPKDKFNTTEPQTERGAIAGWGNAKAFNPQGSYHTYNVGANKKQIKKYNQHSTIVSVVFAILTLAFCSVFLGLAIYAVIYEQSTSTMIFLILSSLFVIFILTMSTIVPIRNKYLEKKINKFGNKSFADNFKLTVTGDTNGTTRGPFYSIKFEFTDDNGFKRHGSDNLKVSLFYFSSFNIKQLPILVWKKYARVDYDELITIQNNKTDKEVL